MIFFCYLRLSKTRVIYNNKMSRKKKEYEKVEQEEWIEMADLN